MHDFVHSIMQNNKHLRKPNKHYDAIIFKRPYALARN